MAPLAGLVPGQDGISSLTEVITLYREWISEREAEIATLDTKHRAAAVRHLDTCKILADRMQVGIERSNRMRWRGRIPVGETTQCRQSRSTAQGDPEPYD